MISSLFPFYQITERFDFVFVTVKIEMFQRNYRLNTRIIANLVSQVIAIYITRDRKLKRQDFVRTLLIRGKAKPRIIKPHVNVTVFTFILIFWISYVARAPKRVHEQ